MFQKCWRCERTITSMRRYQRHMAVPCDQDNVVARRERAAAARDGSVPTRPVRRGRKLMMR